MYVKLKALQLCYCNTMKGETVSPGDINNFSMGKNLQLQFGWHLIVK